MYYPFIFMSQLLAPWYGITLRLQGKDMLVKIQISCVYATQHN